MSIFMTMSRGSTARNLLHNTFYKKLKESNISLVILTTAANDERFQKEFCGSNVEFLFLSEVKDTYCERLFSTLFKFLIYNDNTYMYSRYGYNTKRNRVYNMARYLLFRSIFQPLSVFFPLRKFLRFIDGVFLQRKVVKKYQKLLQERKPSLVFLTSIIDESEVALGKAARRESIPVVAMAKSWDNLSKRYFRVKADRIVVWGQFMSDQAQKLQDYKSEEISIIGIPQFDNYVDTGSILPRDIFCQQLGLDPNKQILFYGSEGNTVPEDSIIVGVLHDFVNQKKFSQDCQVLVRPHPGYNNEQEKFQQFFGKENIIIDKTIQRSSSAFRDQWDYSRVQMDHFLNCLYHSAVVMHVCSTLVLDATAMNRPSILIAFDGYEKRPFYKSVARWYLSDYYGDILRYQATPIAYSPEDLVSQINSFLENPQWLHENREKLKERFCLKVDGHSGERLFQVIQNYEKNINK